MAGMTAVSQQADFAARIARIQSGAASSKQTIFVGMDDSFEWPGRAALARTGAGAGPERKAGGLRSLAVPAMLVLGVVAHGVALLARDAVTGLPPIAERPGTEMLTQFLAGFLVALLVARVLRITAPGLALARSVGVALGVLLLHNAVHLWPDLFARAFSTGWVADVLAATLPQSVLLAGNSLPF